MARSSNAPLLRVDRVTKAFGGLRAVDGVSFEIYSGEIAGLIGPNGSGKSTMINLVSGIHEPTDGEIFYKDGRISGLPPYEIAKLGIGRTFQLLRLFYGLSVFDNVLTATHLMGSRELLAAVLGRAVAGDEEARMRERAREVLEFVGLSHRASVLARQLTAGEGRLLELARALAHDPELVLLDEPAAGLNTAEKEVLDGKLRTLRDQGKAILLVDHEMQLVMGLASRIVVLNEGKLLALGSPTEIQSDPRVIQAYLGAGTVRRRQEGREERRAI
jgi:branched-chain amino acid transport system ATP-binding protein